MAQHDESNGPTATRTPNALALTATPDRTPDVSIFSVPTLEVVFLWWAESNRRWTERNGSNASMSPASTRRDPQQLDRRTSRGVA